MPAEATERRCERCGQRSGPVPAGTVRYDPAWKQRLCNACWFKVNPAPCKPA